MIVIRRTLLECGIFVPYCHVGFYISQKLLELHVIRRECFHFPNPISHVSSAAFPPGSARLGPGSGLLLFTCLREIINFNEESEKSSLPLARDPKYLPRLI